MKRKPPPTFRSTRQTTSDQPRGPNQRSSSSGLLNASKTRWRGASKTRVRTISRSLGVVTFNVPVFFIGDHSAKDHDGQDPDLAGRSKRSLGISCCSITARFAALRRNRMIAVLSANTGAQAGSCARRARNAFSQTDDQEKKMALKAY